MRGKTVIIIPSRYGSTRLPAKALIKVEGKPIIQYVWEKAKKSLLADEVIVATDNQAIVDACIEFGANVVMTDVNHKCGSDRIAEVATNRDDFEYIINVQGDEPLITPESIDTCILILKNTSEADISTLVRVVENKEDLDNPNVVKCVKDKRGFALYFSRSKIPYERNPIEGDFYAHMGIYGYKRDALFQLTSLPQTQLEMTESLEQLRALENGMRIITSTVKDNSVGIDTQADVERFKAELRRGS